MRLSAKMAVARKLDLRKIEPLTRASGSTAVQNCTPPKKLTSGSGGHGGLGGG
jgi:hypothetical protein